MSLIHTEDSMQERASLCFPNSTKDNFGYVLGKVIGSGAAGEVVEAKDASGKTVAVKLINSANTTDHQKIRLIEEVEIHSSLCHPNIVRLLDVFEQEEEGKIGLVMELAPGGDVCDSLDESGRFSEREAAEVGIQVLDCLAYMHHRKVAHRDIKGENMVLMNQRGEGEKLKVKLVDFGLATAIREDLCFFGMYGTPQYMAPEIWRKWGCGRKVDIFALGSTLFTMLTDKSLYRPGPQAFVMQCLEAGRWHACREFKELSSDCQNFLTLLLQANFHDRPTARQALEHPWLSKEAPEDQEEALRQVADMNTDGADYRKGRLHLTTLHPMDPEPTELCARREDSYVPTKLMRPSSSTTSSVCLCEVGCFELVSKLRETFRQKLKKSTRRRSSEANSNSTPNKSKAGEGDSNSTTKQAKPTEETTRERTEDNAADEAMKVEESKKSSTSDLQTMTESDSFSSFSSFSSFKEKMKVVSSNVVAGLALRWHGFS